MATQPFLATIIGIPHIPSIRFVNIRNGASISHTKVMELAVGTSNLRVLEVKEDADRRELGGKVYNWFKLNLPNGQTGWVRDDLISVVGDGTAYGYFQVFVPTVAFNLLRKDMPAVNPIGVREPNPDTTTPINPEEPANPVVVEPVKPTETPTTSTKAMAICMVLGGANLRQGPGTNSSIAGRMNYLDKGEILETSQSGDTNPLLRWIRISYQGQNSWIREDLVRLEGDFGRFDLSPADLYPSCVPQSHWIRDFDPEGKFLARHDGWDQAGNTGAPILAGPQGGFVVESKACDNCGVDGLSVQQKGLIVGSSQVFTPGWNFGYGHYIIVRYQNDILPESTRKTLTSKNMAEAHVFVMYAHLHQRLAERGTTVNGFQQIATMGNSGNSTGTHLHLEVRVGKNANETQWARLRSGLMSPGILFLR